MCVVGFLRLQWLKYKNYRENRNLIAKILSYCEKNLKSASNLNGNLNCSKELEHYSS